MEINPAQMDEFQGLLLDLVGADEDERPIGVAHAHRFYRNFLGGALNLSEFTSIIDSISWEDSTGPINATSRLGFAVQVGAL